MAEPGNRQLTALVVILLAFTAASLLVIPRRGRSMDPRASTLLTTEMGAGALYETMRTLGVPAARRYSPFVEADPLRGPLVMLAVGTVGLSTSERNGLVAWVRSGGTLVFAPGHDASLFGWLTRSLDLGDHTPVVPAAFLRIPRFPSTPTDHEWASGVDSVPPAASAFRSLPPELEYEALIETEAGDPVTIVYVFGRGRVVALADQTLVSNETARAHPGAVQIMVRAAANLAEPGDTVWFDEYHHGFTGGGHPVRALWDFARERPAGRALAQLGLAALGLLLLLGRRLGAPRAPAPARRRSPLEHVDALARVYHGAEARPTARRLLMAGLARRLREPAAAGETEADALLDRLRSHPTRAEPARRLAAALAADAAPAAIANAIDDVIHPERNE
ncbi:MAG TPA: DUF4350 domain-containing protein [Longimicrobiales bacterium]|nr:DUF4350 domain-containing protein [Longimicrobiales bacterium]